MNISQLEQMFKRVWSSETSAFPSVWCEENPAIGQCLSTTRVIQNYLGGEIVCRLTTLGPHFLNRFDNGCELDLTRSQFPDDYVFSNDKDIILSATELDAFGLIFPEIARRYKLLADKFAQLINEDFEISIST